MGLFYTGRLLIISIFLILLSFNNLIASQPLNTSSGKPGYNISLRPVYYYINTTERDGVENTEQTINLRARVGISYHLTSNLIFRGRTAMRLSSNQEKFRFLLDSYTSGSGSYPAGILTVDEFLLTWELTPGMKLTAGRFQGRFPLTGLIPKGVDRYYGSNLAISHTDGIWMEWDATSKWRLHLIASHNSTAGSSHAARSPLRFDESGSARITGFANIQHRDTQGKWAQRELSISVTPQNFYRDGELRNHVVLSTRWMYRPAFTISGEEYMFGGELGFIPVAPRPSDAGFQIDDDRLMFGSSALSWQLSAYFDNIFENHWFGILYGQTDPHWLVSASFAPNVTMAEMRYRYTITSWIHYEFRLRLRDEIYRPLNANQTRKIFDFYTRFTVSF